MSQTLYAQATGRAISFGTFLQLFPNTSATDENGFAAKQGYSLVLASRPYDAATQALQPCGVYVEEGAFYSVKVAPVDLEVIKTNLVAVVQKRLDAFAQKRGYDGILSACTYATSSVERFRSEGQAAVEARDATWSACYAALAAIQGGAPMPKLADFMANLPAIDWL